MIAEARRLDIGLVALAALGALLLIYGLTIPVYTDYEAATAVKLVACDENGVVSGWYDRLAAYMTLRHDFMQSGVSLLLAAATLWFLDRLFSDPTDGTFRSPSAKWQFIGLGLVSLFIGWIGLSYSFVLDASRGEVPSCADSLGIPLSALTTTFAIITPVCVLIGVIISLAFGKLPSRLFHWPSERLGLNLILTAVFGGAAVLLGILLVDSAHTSSFLDTPALIIQMYLLLATRAALLERR